MLTGLFAAAVVAVVPPWPATYNLSRSTFLMPCNYTGFFNPVSAAQYGIVDFDWSNAKAEWTKQHPMDCEERLVEQAKLIKAINPDTKIYIYRNLVKALPWCVPPSFFKVSFFFSPFFPSPRTSPIVLAAPSRFHSALYSAC